MIRVLIADDFPQMIEVIERLIEAGEDTTVAGVIKDFRTVLEQIMDMEFEVVLMNDYLPPTTSVTATKRLREMDVTAPILVMSVHRDAQLIRDSLDAGANGFIFKEEFSRHLLQAIRAVLAGDQYLSPMAASTLEAQD